MPAFKNLTGQRFGKLTALYRTECHKRTEWMCQCDCGVRKSIWSNALTRSEATHCGCQTFAHRSRARTKHGSARPGKKTRTYNIWIALRQRCNDPNSINYPNYGGRGISVCPEWDSFEQFLQDMGKVPSKHHSIGRIDVNLGYSPSNCRWETQTQQARNTRRNHLITYNGQTKCMAEWAEHIGISYHTFRTRINLGWPIERVMTQQPRKSPGKRTLPKRLVTFRGKTQSISEWANEYGMGHMTLHSRLKKGWPIERALTTPVKKR